MDRAAGSSRKKGLHALFARNPIAADRQVFGRKSDPLTRRGFLSGLGTMSALVGAPIVFHPLMPAGLIPAALANSDIPFSLPGKDPRLVVLNDRPINAETPAHLLDDRVTPAERMFVRNNGLPPPTLDEQTWGLTFGGEAVRAPRSYTLAELKQRFTPVSLQLVLECGGNGRSEFMPPASGNQWTTGAVACPRFDGIRLADVLDDVGITDSAVYLGYIGADTHLSGDPTKQPISRGVPMAKALEPESLLAFGMNGAPLHPLNGHPLRLAIGGWPASVSGKWLTELLVRDRVHDGAKMGGQSYRVPCEPVEPGEDVPDEAMCIIESMPVKSLITFPESGLRLPLGKTLSLRGHAWAGDRQVDGMAVSIDFGQTWRPAKLEAPANRLAWQHFETEIDLPERGYYEVWARATDDTGKAQPMVIPDWNPKGYLNNACHRIAVYAV
ncbi:MAG: sulfite oxidase [Pseudomonadota bacterium]